MSIQMQTLESRCLFDGSAFTITGEYFVSDSPDMEDQIDLSVGYNATDGFNALDFQLTLTGHQDQGDWGYKSFSSGVQITGTQVAGLDASFSLGGDFSFDENGDIGSQVTGSLQFDRAFGLDNVSFTFDNIAGSWNVSSNYSTLDDNLTVTVSGGRDGSGNYTASIQLKFTP